MFHWSLKAMIGIVALILRWNGMSNAAPTYETTKRLRILDSDRMVEEGSKNAA